MNKKAKIGMGILSILFVLSLGMSLFLYFQVEKYKPQIEAYLPEDLYVAVGNEISLYNDQVSWSGDRSQYYFNWDCQIGENLEDSFHVEGLEEQLGDYSLTLTVFDVNMNELMTLTSTLHVVDALIEGEYSITNIGDSLSNGRKWYEYVFDLSDGQLTFTGTRGWEEWSNEGRSGFSAMDYLNPTEYVSDGVSEGIHPFWDPAQEMFDWNYYKLYTGKDPDMIQIFLGTNGLKDDPSETVNAIKEMIKNIRAHDSEIPIYLVNTIYWGDQKHIGTAKKQNGLAYITGEFKARSDKRVFDLMVAMSKEFAGEKGITMIPLALTHNSDNNYEMGEFLHPNDIGDQEFATAMYNVYCGTLE